MLVYKTRYLKIKNKTKMYTSALVCLYICVTSLRCINHHRKEYKYETGCIS